MCSKLFMTLVDYGGVDILLIQFYALAFLRRYLVQDLFEAR